MKRYLKKKIVYIPLVFVTVAVFASVIFWKDRSSARLSHVVSRETISQEVEVSGTVKAAESVELAFDRSGRVARVYATVGSMVGRGTLLVSLENATEAANLENALADLKAKEFRLAELEVGTRPEEIAVKEADLEKVQSDLSTYLHQISPIVSDAYNKVDKAVTEQTDLLFSNDRTEPQLSFSVSNHQVKINAERGRFEIEKVLASFKALSADGEIKEENLATAYQLLQEVNAFLLKMSEALNSASNLTDATAASYKEDLNTARINLNNALSDVTDQRQKITTQKVTVKKAERELALARAGTATEVLDQAWADVERSKASVRSSQATLAKTHMYAPLSGVITLQEAKPGQIVTAGEILVSIMNQNSFIIEANLPEADIAKVSVGDKASVTLDAYGNNAEFEATLATIDPAERVIEGISTYKVTLTFDQKDARVRSGMTANIVLATERKEAALSLPQRAVYERDGKKYVTKLSADRSEIETEVTTGIKGGSGRVEVITGVSEGDEILLKAR